LWVGPFPFPAKENRGPLFFFTLWLTSPLFPSFVLQFHGRTTKVRMRALYYLFFFFGGDYFLLDGRGMSLFPFSFFSLSFPPWWGVSKKGKWTRDVSFLLSFFFPLSTAAWKAVERTPPLPFFFPSFLCSYGQGETKSLNVGVFFCIGGLPGMGMLGVARLSISFLAANYYRSAALLLWDLALHSRGL